MKQHDRRMETMKREAAGPLELRRIENATALFGLEG
jgi:hypothetical protein